MANLWNFGLANSVRIFHGVDHVSALHAKFLILVWFGVKGAGRNALETGVGTVNVHVHCGYLADYYMLELFCATLRNALLSSRLLLPGPQ